MELVIANPAAAYPLPPGRVFLDKSGRHERGWPLLGGMASFRFGRLLLGGDKQPDLERRDSNELFVDQASTRHIAVEGGPTLTENALDSVLPPKDAHGFREIDEGFLSSDDNLDMRM